MCDYLSSGLLRVLLLLSKHHSSSVRSKSCSSCPSGSGNSSRNRASSASKSSGSALLVPPPSDSESPGDQDPVAPQTSSSCCGLPSKHCTSPDNEHSSPPRSSCAHSLDPNLSHADHSPSSDDGDASVSPDER